MSSRKSLPKIKAAEKFKTKAARSEGVSSSMIEAIDGSILNMLMQALETDDAQPSVPNVKLDTDSVREGKRFGKWKILSREYKNPGCKEPYFLLRCECGTIQARPQSSVVSGQSQSCGCSQKISRKKA